MHNFSNMDFFEETSPYVQFFSEISHNILFTHESPKIQNSAETFQRLQKKPMGIDPIYWGVFYFCF